MNLNNDFDLDSSKFTLYLFTHCFSESELNNLLEGGN